MKFSDIIQTQMRIVVREFSGQCISTAKVHESQSLSALLDLLTLMEDSPIVPAKPRRQGIMGRRQARNHMLRKALFIARTQLRPRKPNADFSRTQRFFSRRPRTFFA